MALTIKVPIAIVRNSFGMEASLPSLFDTSLGRARQARTRDSFLNRILNFCQALYLLPAAITARKVWFNLVHLHYLTSTADRCRDGAEYFAFKNSVSVSKRPLAEH